MKPPILHFVHIQSIGEFRKLHLPIIPQIHLHHRQPARVPRWCPSLPGLQLGPLTPALPPPVCPAARAIFWKPKSDPIMPLLKLLNSFLLLWGQNWKENWKRSLIIPIPKKGDAKECSNYCTISLISRAGKVMLKILQARLQLGFPGGPAGKESACNAGDLGLIPGLGREKGRRRRERLPTPVFWPGESHGLYSPKGRKGVDKTLSLLEATFHFWASTVH